MRRYNDRHQERLCAGRRVASTSTRSAVASSSTLESRTLPAALLSRPTSSLTPASLNSTQPAAPCPQSLARNGFRLSSSSFFIRVTTTRTPLLLLLSPISLEDYTGLYRLGRTRRLVSHVSHFLTILPAQYSHFTVSKRSCSLSVLLFIPPFNATIHPEETERESERQIEGERRDRYSRLFISRRIPTKILELVMIKDTDSMATIEKEEKERKDDPGQRGAIR